MAIKVNDFVIQAQVIEDSAADDNEKEISADNASATLPDSVKKEIVDECLEKMKEYLIREKSRF